MARMFSALQCGKRSHILCGWPVSYTHLDVYKRQVYQQRKNTFTHLHSTFFFIFLIIAMKVRFVNVFHLNGTYRNHALVITGSYSRGIFFLCYSILFFPLVRILGILFSPAVTGNLFIRIRQSFFRVQVIRMLHSCIH